mgnify:CR=1 FL=1
MTPTETIPVTLLTGFLGSGKTTVLNRLLHRLRALNPAAPILTVVQGEVDPAHVLDLPPFPPGDRATDARRWLVHGRYRPALAEHSPGEGESHLRRFRAFSLGFDQPLDWPGVEADLQTLAGLPARNLLRMKAIINLVGRDSPVLLQGVSTSSTPGRTTRLAGRRSPQPLRVRHRLTGRWFRRRAVGGFQSGCRDGHAIPMRRGGFTLSARPG